MGTPEVTVLNGDDARHPTPHDDAPSRVSAPGQGSSVRWRALGVAAMFVIASGLPTLAPTIAGAGVPTLTRVGTVSRQLAAIYSPQGTREAFSTPAIADVTGDGRPDLVTAALDGTVAAHALPSRTQIWKVSVGRTSIQTSPAVVDLTGDRKNDVVIGTMDGRVLLLDGPTGRVVRTFYQGPPLHCPPGNDCRPDGFFATPAIADVNGDGVLDIVAASWDHTVYAWSSRGPLLWRRFLEDTLWSSPVVADIDRDGSPEIILGGDIYANNPLGKPAGGLVWILKRDGSTYPGYPRSLPGQTVWSSPAVGDINSDGNLDVVIGSGTNFPSPAGRRVEAFTARTGRSLPGWPVGVDGRVMGSPAIGNLDGDAQLEVAFASEGGWVYAYDTNGARRWRACNAASCGSFNSHGTVSIADVDGDGTQEVVSALDRNLQVFSPSNGAVEASVALTAGGWAPVSAPTIAEVDGKTIIAQSTSNTVLNVDLVSTGKPLCLADWPTFKHDARRSGRMGASAGAAWVPFACPADFVAQQYKDFLGRPLDAAGSAYWTGQLRGGTAGSTVIEQYMGSPEFGRVVAPIVRANFALFGTYPQSAEAVRAGAVSLRQGTKLAAITDGLAATPSIAVLTDTQFVQRIYQNLYRRPATASELAADVAKLGQGTTRGTVASGHAEWAAGRLAAEVNVTMTYLGMLNRVPDRGGWAYWVPAARKGTIGALITGFQRSSEYRNRVL
ncbi:MAG: FG-GAP-like repeat-containing protein [Aquihabitans sp.]